MYGNMSKIVIFIWIGSLIAILDAASIHRNNTIRHKNASKTTKESGRTLYGLLGFLTGFRFGQGLPPTSYEADHRDTTQLNLFAKFFNGALFLAYGRQPVQLLPNSYPPISNIYPTGLQPPIWYPPILNPLLLQGNGPINQQQIVNVHEPFNPNDAPNENYQESSVHNVQDISNAFPSAEQVAGVLEKIDNITAVPTVEIAKNILKKTCDNDTCSETEGEMESFENETDSINMIDDLNPDGTENDPKTELPDQTTTEASKTSTTEPVHSTTISTASNTTGIPANESSTVTTTTNSPPKNESSTVTYPYSYNQNASNSTYDHISITENPHNYLKQDYYDTHWAYDYHPTYEIIAPHTDRPVVTNFYPMGGNFYDNGLVYHDYYEKFSKKQDDSGFKPMTSNYLV